MKGINYTGAGRVLVTGASGTVGRALIDDLRAADHPVRAAYHSRTQADNAAEAGHDAVAVDFADPTTLPPALDGVESVFLLGAMGSQQTDHELTVVRAAEAVGVSRIVKLSVWRADERLTPIADLHRPVEEALERSSVSWTFLRPNFFMQNFSRSMADSIKHDGVIAQSETDGPISFVDARDVARVAERVLTSDGHHGRIYAISGPEALTYEQVAASFSQTLGRQIRFVPLTDQQARRGMLDAGMPEFDTDALIKVNAAYRHGGAEAVLTTVADLTGRQPGTLEQFIHDHRATFV